MIQITCTSCKNVLSIDDAFAGGVCRCQHCGTIQTVPARLKAGAEKVEAGASTSKLLYQNKARASSVAAGSGSGLDDLAGAIASSGLSDTRLRKPAAPAYKSPIVFLIAAGTVIVMLIVLVVVLLTRGNKPETPGNGTSSQNPQTGFSSQGQVVDNDGGPTETKPKPPTITGPNCCGIKLTSDSVVYLIDNGSSAKDTLDYVKAAVYHSIESLGPQKQFQIIFWNPDSVTFGPVAATPANLDEARKKIEDVIAFKSTEPLDGFKKAIASKPGEIVIITGKAMDIDDATTESILAARGNSTVKVHIVAIGGSDADAAAAGIAKKTGGTFSPISARDLQTMGN